MVRLWVEEVLALHPHACLDVLESAQVCIVLDVCSNLNDNQSARDDERAPHAVQEKHRQHPVWHNEILFLRAEGRRRLGITMCGMGYVCDAHLFR
jgi:hypothetical protein